MAGVELSAKSLAKTTGGFVATFELLIDTWAGRTTLEVFDGAQRSAVVLEIAPSERKLGPNEFDQMLAELSSIGEALPWGMSPGAAQGAVSRDAPVAVHPAVIASQLSVLEALLDRYAQEPPVVTLRAREHRPLDVARRADLRTLRWLGRHPAVLHALTKREGGEHLDPRTPVDQPLALTSFDHPVTRYIHWLLVRIRARFALTSRILRSSSGVHGFADPVADAYAHELATEVDRAAARIAARCATPLFRCAQPTPLVESAVQSVADHPLYAAIHRIAQRLLAPGLAYGPDGQILTALKRTYDLFELLVLYRLVRQLPERLGREWQIVRAAAVTSIGREDRPSDRALWVLRGPNGLFLEIRYQQWFPRARSHPDRRRFSSLSGLNIPDYVLVLRRGREVLSWVILDAKYRSGRQPIDQGLGDVHRYRDALRIFGTRAAAGYVIAPRLQDVDPVYASPDYLRDQRFGVLQLYGGDWLKPLVVWVEEASVLEPAAKP